MHWHTPTCLEIVPNNQSHYFGNVHGERRRMMLFVVDDGWMDLVVVKVLVVVVVLMMMMGSVLMRWVLVGQAR